MFVALDSGRVGPNVKSMKKSARDWEGSGFTLVELLLTLFVVSLLAGLSAAGASGWRRLAQAGETEARLHAIVSACRFYRVDHGRWPPAFDSRGVLSLAESATWQAELGAYLEGHPVGRPYPDGYGNLALYALVDVDGDGWIEGRDMPVLTIEERPARVRARIVSFSVGGDGGLAGQSWEAHAAVW